MAFLESESWFYYAQTFKKMADNLLIKDLKTALTYKFVQGRL